MRTFKLTIQYDGTNYVGWQRQASGISIQSLIEDAPQLQHFLSESGYIYGSLFGECSILASFTMNWHKQHALLEVRTG